jgi:hypothetical protein
VDFESDLVRWLIGPWFLWYDRIKEELRKRFAELVNSCERNIQDINSELANLEGPLEVRGPLGLCDFVSDLTCQFLIKKSQMARVNFLQSKLPQISQLLNDVEEAEKDCMEANVEENDYTIYTFEDVEFEYKLIQKRISKKLAFIENQVRTFFFWLGERD